ncbi:MAG: hypothetical protein E5W82_31950 [Mesorhizobium sp.]|nr:MAG: hypothetical protein E5W82_31950 [Mesorhizobium sp.]
MAVPFSSIIVYASHRPALSDIDDVITTSPSKIGCGVAHKKTGHMAVTAERQPAALLDPSQTVRQRSRFRQSSPGRLCAQSQPFSLTPADPETCHSFIRH